MEGFSLKEFVTWILSGGGAGVIAYFIMDKIPALAQLGADYKRYLSLALSGVIASSVWLGTLWMGWSAAPVSPQDWVEAVLSVIGTAVITAQVIHGVADLRPKRLSLIRR